MSAFSNAAAGGTPQLRLSHTGLSHPYCLDPTPLLERQRQQESNARSYPRRIPLVLERAQGIYVQDSRGQVFVDCLAGAGTLALGHNHPVVVEAITQVLASGLPMHTLDLMTPVKDAFVQEIFGCLPADFARNARIQFCGPSGADAVEAALKLTRTATGRHSVLAFEGAYHGMTLGTLAISGNLSPKNALGGLMAGVQRLPYPHDYRCPYGVGGEQGVSLNLHYLKHLLSDPESGVTAPAAMILEPIQGEGGVIAAPDRWLQGLRELTQARGIPLIVDEIQCGIARSGRMFGFEHSGITPDVITLSKAIGGGLPLSVMVYNDSLDLWEPGAHAGTFRGNQLAMAAGTATLRFIREQGLVAHAERAGAHLRKQLQALQQEFAWIGDVRGRGLMLGMEIVDPQGGADAQGHPPVDSARAKAFQQACLKHGLIVELGGRHGATVRFLPPLIITEQEIDFVAQILFQAASTIDQNPLP
ncbi:diaminobutyrate--2-oxoglutarate transaminase [Pseudomonas sp. DTU_2021_1001937_2_SI_NGA_ILE_001]|uniref:diaminobutyrate--2-oxoglutarate transaminase n=1 Tax=Pseudomonas sp. DTU_2021_1001937_2_SI_NGA_ILE_001 TaxID=3077589 RepID=UPI0028FC2A34|nr:diaminobutyrate--2-oxoglutarate transaminase [Pseudomonas sp. DTU_2021_1001937_2_SI_NGA_ILE_001]WNW10406.1 diaminobutyrate--2-oxoglutarate transaminase [Pseudomonas sp. DTU_2021_1001937_2_SI_NGA_ILE_001]